MSDNIVFDKLRNFISNGNEKSYDDALKIIDEQLAIPSSKEIEKELEKIKVDIQIKKLNIELDKVSDDNFNKKINLHGRIIRLYKKIEKQTDNENEKMKYRLDMINEIKRHREIIREYKKNPKTKISLPKKIGLTILEFGNMINIFIKEKDIIQKFKNIIKETKNGVKNSIILTIIIEALVQPLTLLFSPITLLCNMIPIVCYIGLSSIIRNLFNKSKFEKFEYRNSEEYKKMLEKFNSEYKTEIDSISSDLKNKEMLDDIEDVIEVNERLILKFDLLASKIKDSEMKSVFYLQTLSLLRENKDYCEGIKNKYLNEKDNDIQKYKENNKRLMKINLELFKRENSIKESLKYNGKNILSSLKVMIIARAILSYLLPGFFSFKNTNDLLMSFAIIVINGILDIPSYKEKLKYKKTDYEGKVKMRNMKRIEKMIEDDNNYYSQNVKPLAA